MSYRLELGLAVLLAGAVGVAVWAANRTAKPPAYDSRASTFLSGPLGSKALYAVLVRLGRPVERRRSPLFTLADDTVRPLHPALLVVLNPPIHLQPAELQRVVRFVLAGGAVLAAGGGGGITRCAGWRLAPERALGDSVAVRSPRPALRLPRVARVLAPRRREPARDDLEELVKRQLSEKDPCAPLAELARGGDTLLAAADGRPVVLRLHYEGGGTITIAADAGWFRNQTWRDTDVPFVVLPLLVPSGERRGRVAWDEYHQGFGREGPALPALTWDWLRQTPAGWVVLQLGAVALVWLAMTAVRFGPARSAIERRRRSPVEHLEALAAGLESAGDADTAIRRLVAGLGRRLHRTNERWFDSLELVMRGSRGRAAVRRLRHLITERGGAPSERVLAAAQAVEDVWEELRPRTTRDAF